MGPDGCDIDEQSGLVVDPSRINHIQVVFVRRIGISRVDLQHVISLLVRMDRHIVVFRQEVDRIVRHLNIDIRVPWQDLASVRTCYIVWLLGISLCGSTTSLAMSHV